MQTLRPNKGELKNTFISRFMGDETMARGFPDMSDRMAACNSQWDRRKEDVSLDSVPAMPNESLLLTLSDDDDGWVTLGDIELAGPSKIPQQRFVKTIIKAGEWFKQSENLNFTVTPEVMCHWVDTFNAMKKNGVKVWIPADHKSEKEVEAQPKSDLNRGFVDQMFVEGDDLKMIATIVGEDAIVSAQRNDVSIKTVPEYVDGKGTSHRYPIRFVSLCPNPVIPGLGEWTPIAASEEAIMPDLKKTRALLGIDDSVKDEDLDAAVEAKVKEREAKTPTITASSESDDGKNNDGADKKEDAKPVTFHPLQLSAVSENRELKIDRAVERGQVLPAEAKKLKELFATKDALTLALSSESGDAFDGVMAAIEERPKMKRDELTGKQVPDVELSDDAKGKGDEDNEVLADAKRREEAAKK